LIGCSLLAPSILEDVLVALSVVLDQRRGIWVAKRNSVLLALKGSVKSAVVPFATVAVKATTVAVVVSVRTAMAVTSVGSSLMLAIVAFLCKLLRHFNAVFDTLVLSVDRGPFILDLKVPFLRVFSLPLKFSHSLLCFSSLKLEIRCFLFCLCCLALG